MFYTLDGILEIDLFKAQAAARTKLSEQGQIRSDDRGYLCIAPVVCLSAIMIIGLPEDGI